ncbi:GNAT family N-acetyltransferase [Dokdonia ponticola]|uniref:GNAT family N-acetyltransferase n=1 Tax=Dokdonia ponticola TaxID=2041041 RepID=A0ABV9HT45_9FLAO
MNFFIFELEKHEYLIDTFLESASLSHNKDKKTKEWFLWKFKDNSFGKPILACVEDQNKIVACVALGKQDFILGSKIIKGALSFETFVHPDYQGKGIFSKLIGIAEKEAIHQGICVLLNFPNSNSLRGFIKKKWNYLDISEYRVKPRLSIFNFLFFYDIKKSFEIAKPSENFIALPQNFTQESLPKKVQCQLTLPYLKWRFDYKKNLGYCFLSNDYFDCLFRYGKRGRLRESQILYFNIKSNSFTFKHFYKEVFKSQKYDLISFLTSTNNTFFTIIKKNTLFKVPNNVNICYKILDENAISKGEFNTISITGINYHTY